MNAGDGRPIPELAAVYELEPLMTYDGWEYDAKSQESRWVFGSSTAAGIKSAVERMRRKQRLHDSSLDLFSGTAGARPPQAGFPGLSDGVRA